MTIKNTPEKRTATLSALRVTDSERACVIDSANQAKLRLSEYRRRMLLTGKIIVKNNAIDQAAVYQLAAIGNNLNQIARQLNSNGQLNRSRLEVCLERLESLLKDLGQ